MKSFVLVFTLFLFSQVLFSLDKFELEAGGSFGGLVDGEQKDFFTSILKPSPTEFTYFGGNLNAKYFPVEYAGVVFGGTYFGSLTVQSQSSTSLTVLTLSSLEFGLATRFPLYQEDELKMTLNLNVGLNYSFFSYDSGFISLVPSGYYLLDVGPALGFFVAPGVQFFSTSNIYFGISLKYSRMNGHISKSGTEFTGTYIVVPVVIGLAI